MRRLLAILSLMTFPFLASAQYAGERDADEVYKYSKFEGKQLIAPAVLTGAGLAIHYFAHESLDYAVRDRFQEWSGGEDNFDWDDHLQYAPLAMDLGLGLVGAPAKNSFVDRAIESAIAHLFLGITSASAKHVFHTLRPNERNWESFPSGHCDFVFANAELTRMEYGWGWGGLAYGMAATVGTCRMYRNWHWFSDVIAGAGLGIFSARVGGWLLEPVKDFFGVPETTWGSGKKKHKAQAALVPAVDPFNGSYYASFALRF